MIGHCSVIHKWAKMFSFVSPYLLITFQYFFSLFPFQTTTCLVATFFSLSIEHFKFNIEKSKVFLVIIFYIFAMVVLVIAATSD